MSWNASQLVLRLTKGPIDCTGDNVDIFNDIQKTVSCHVCLSTGAVVGLAFHAQTGLISLVALLALLYIIARNYIRNHREPPPGPWRLFRGNVDILMLNVIIADMIMSLGAISDMRWAYDRQVYCGSFCDAQGIVQTLGETAAALSTLAVAIYTFIAVNSRRPPVYRPWLCWITVVIIWLWCVLWPVILLRKYDTPGPGGGEDVHYAYTPTPWWCWINSKYLPERIVAEYLWLWIAGIFSIGLYIPAYYIVRNQQNMFREPIPDADRRSVASTIDETNEAVKMLWYPLAYTLCVLPLSIMRWAAFANPDLLNRSQVMPATMVFSSIFNLMGLINVLLIYWTRPAILLIGSDGTLPPTDTRYTLSKEEVSTTSSLQSLPPSGNIRQGSHQTSSRRGDNGFGGENVNLPREPVA